METLQAPLASGSDQSPYQPIDSDGGEIRLVELLPGEYDDPINLSLRTVKMGWWAIDEDEEDSDEDDSDEDDSDDDETYEDETDEEESDGDESYWEESGGWYTYMPSFNRGWYTFTPSSNRKLRYEALSYAWGTAISPRKAVINGFELRITGSLDQGLRRLRLKHRPRTLWIDALCINQRDLKERSHQVQHMAMIYKSAKHVLIWLGEWPNSADCARPDNCQMLWVNTVIEEDKTNMSLSSTPRHICQHYLDIMALPWFRRLWIIQEMALARKDPLLLLDSLCIQWTDLFQAATELLGGQSFQRSDLIFPMSEGWTRLAALHQIRKDRNSHRGLYWCLVMAQAAIATDQRDRVYGLLGLCDFQITEPIVADYSKCMEHVLAEATLASILEEAAFPYLDPKLRPTGVIQSSHGDSSWVIDFLTIPTPENYYEVFNTKLDVEDQKMRRGSIYLSACYGTLYAHGRHIGTICEMQTYCQDEESNIADMDSHRITDTEIYDFYHHVLRPRGMSSLTLLHTLRQYTPSQEESNQFANLLLGSRDDFRPTFVETEMEGRDVFVTEEGHLGVTWHPSNDSISKGAILVCLFGTEVPFVLSPVPGTQSYKMINVAYVPGCGDKILENPYEHSKRKAWIDFAAEGGREYAIV